MCGCKDAQRKGRWRVRRAGKAVGLVVAGSEGAALRYAVARYGPGVTVEPL